MLLLHVLPVNLDFSDGSGSARVSIDADCLVYLAFVSEILFQTLVVQSSFLLNAWKSKLHSDRSVVFPSESCRLLRRRCSIFCFYSQLTRSLAVYLFSLVELKVYSFECCIDRHIVLNHRLLIHPDPTFVGFFRCMLSNMVTFKVSSRSKLSVEVASDDRSLFCVAVSLYVLCTFSICMSAFPECVKYTLVNSILR